MHFLVNDVGEKTAVVVPIEAYRHRVAGDGADRWREFTPSEAALIGAGLAQSDPHRVSGAVCFVAAPRFQVAILFDNLDAGLPLDKFCSEVYPDDVPREILDKALKVRHRLLSMGPVPAERA